LNYILKEETSYFEPYDIHISDKNPVTQKGNGAIISF